MALEAGEVETLTPIRLRYTGKVLDMTPPTTIRTSRIPILSISTRSISPPPSACDPQRRASSRHAVHHGLLKKKGIGQLVNYCNQNLGLEVTVSMLDRIKSLGFNYATKSGCQWALTTWLFRPASTPSSTKPTRR